MTANASSLGRLERLLAVLAIALWLAVGAGRAPAAEMEFIRVAADKHSFALDKSGRKFSPWGFNYDHDEAGRLLEDYWSKEWPKVEEDFGEMKHLGANVVRIHLQFGRFMEAAERP